MSFNDKHPSDGDRKPTTKVIQWHKNLNGKVSEFLMKTFDLVNVCHDEYDDVLCWTTDGEGFVVKDRKKLESKVIPQYFNHKNISSFHRQLSFYNFSKDIPDFMKQGLINDERMNHTVYRHPFFKKDKPLLLRMISRSTKSKTALESVKDDVEVFRLELQNREESMKRKFTEACQDTESKLRELEHWIQEKKSRSQDADEFAPNPIIKQDDFPDHAHPQVGRPPFSRCSSGVDSLDSYMDTLPDLFAPLLPEDNDNLDEDVLNKEHTTSVKGPSEDDFIISSVLPINKPIKFGQHERSTSCDSFLSAIIKEKEIEAEMMNLSSVSTTLSLMNVAGDGENKALVPMALDEITAIEDGGNKAITNYARFDQMAELQGEDLNQALTLQRSYNSTCCPICLEDFHVGEVCYPNNDSSTVFAPNIGDDGLPLRLLRCGHVFHHTCWKEYITIGHGNINTCPICKKDVS